MKRRQNSMVLIAFLCCVFAMSAGAQNAYVDQPFLQDFSEKVPLAPSVGDAKLLKVRADRNGRISVLSDKGLLQVHEGRLVPDRLHRPLADMHVVDIETHDGQFVYLTDEFILSNAWAGKLLVEHQVSGAHRLVMGKDSDFLVVGDKQSVLFHDGKPVQDWKQRASDVKQAVFYSERERYLLLTRGTIEVLGRNMNGTLFFEMPGELF